MRGLTYLNKIELTNPSWQFVEIKSTLNNHSIIFIIILEAFVNKICNPLKLNTKWQHTLCLP